MANQGDKPKRFVKGQTISARDLNQIRELTPRLISGGPNIFVNSVGDRHLVTSYNKIDGQAVLLQTMAIIKEHDDYLVCVPVSYDNTDTVIHSPTIGSNRPTNLYVNVAKPRLLQKEPFHNQTVLLNGVGHTYVYTGIGQRTDTANGITTTQQITPQYFPGDIIIARRGPTGVFSVGGGGNLQNSNPMWYEDVNEGARVWGSLSVSSSLLVGSSYYGVPTSMEPIPTDILNFDNEYYQGIVPYGQLVTLTVKEGLDSRGYNNRMTSVGVTVKTEAQLVHCPYTPTIIYGDTPGYWNSLLSGKNQYGGDQVTAKPQFPDPSAIGQLGRVHFGGLITAVSSPTIHIAIGRSSDTSVGGVTLTVPTITNGYWTLDANFVIIGANPYSGVGYSIPFVSPSVRCNGWFRIADPSTGLQINSWIVLGWLPPIGGNYGQYTLNSAYRASDGTYPNTYMDLSVLWVAGATSSDYISCGEGVIEFIL